MWGFPKIRGTLLGVPKIRIIVFWGYIGVPLFWETIMFCCNVGSASRSCPVSLTSSSRFQEKLRISRLALGTGTFPLRLVQREFAICRRRPCRKDEAVKNERSPFADPCSHHASRVNLALLILNKGLNRNGFARVKISIVHLPSTITLMLGTARKGPPNFGNFSLNP